MYSKLTGSNLSSANNVSINVPNGSVVLVNIGGTTLTWTGGLVVNGTAISNVLFNFYQATSLTIQGIDITGSVSCTICGGKLYQRSSKWSDDLQVSHRHGSVQLCSVRWSNSS